MDAIRLPEPRRQSNVSVESALQNRRSVREYRDEPLTLAEVSQLLWAAQGITGPEDRRTAPSAGALYPLEVYLVAGRVNDLASGIYRYQPRRHELVRIVEGDKRIRLAAAALDQDCVRHGAATIVVAAVYERVTKKYGKRGVMYVHMEAGHAAQNVFLQAVALNLGTVVVGAFEDDPVKKLLTLPVEEQPLYLLPVGRPK
jgi:SagB-type dehydrogenase family enzyme